MSRATENNTTTDCYKFSWKMDVPITEYRPGVVIPVTRINYVPNGYLFHWDDDENQPTPTP